MTQQPAKKRGRPRKQTKPEPVYQVKWVSQNPPQRLMQWLKNIAEAIWYFPPKKRPDLVRTGAPLPDDWETNTTWTIS